MLWMSIYRTGKAGLEPSHLAAAGWDRHEESVACRSGGNPEGASAKSVKRRVLAEGTEQTAQRCVAVAIRLRQHMKRSRHNFMMPELGCS